MDDSRKHLAERVLVLTDQFGHVVKDVRRYVVQGDEVQDDEDERLVRREIEEDLADLITQIGVLASELGYSGSRYDSLVEEGQKRMEERKKEYEAKGWHWI